MKLEHRVSMDWLRERKKYLTASEVFDLLPITATGRKRSEDQINAKRLEIWASKQEEPTEDDALSTGTAARGHLLEPYAIAAVNKLVSPIMEEVDDNGELLDLFVRVGMAYHWDDALIYNNGLAYSPDALDIPQPIGNKVSYSVDEIKPTQMIEVKSYNAAKHYTKGFADKMKLEERWQIATAFSVSDSLMGALLVLFHPGCKDKLFIHSYSREELEEEIKTILEVKDATVASLGEFKSKAADLHWECDLDNKQIMNEILEEIRINKELNPV